jgi:hypothetical protein
MREWLLLFIFSTRMREWLLLFIFSTRMREQLWFLFLIVYSHVYQVVNLAPEMLGMVSLGYLILTLLMISVSINKHNYCTKDKQQQSLSHSCTKDKQQQSLSHSCTKGKQQQSLSFLY